MAGRRRAEREQYWRSVIERQQASGLSVAECRRNDVADALFYRWRRKLAELEEREGRLPEIQENGHGGRSQAVAQLVPIEISPPPPRRVLKSSGRMASGILVHLGYCEYPCEHSTI